MLRRHLSGSEPSCFPQGVLLLEGEFPFVKCREGWDNAEGGAGSGEA